MSHLRLSTSQFCDLHPAAAFDLCLYEAEVSVLAVDVARRAFLLGITICRALGELDNHAAALVAIDTIERIKAGETPIASVGYALSRAGLPEHIESRARGHFVSEAMRLFNDLSAHKELRTTNGCRP